MRLNYSRKPSFRQPLIPLGKVNGIISILESDIYLLRLVRLIQYAEHSDCRGGLP
jgi:hypothetical protein